MKKENKPKLKVILRGIPYFLTEEQMRTTLEKYLPDIDFWYFVSGKQTQKKIRDSTAYINFINFEALCNFFNNFEGHRFVTEKGVEKKVSIEYAPFQKIPKGKQRQDATENTIESDPDYQSFLEKLNEPVQLLPSAEKQLEEREEKEKEMIASGTTFQTTPLLEYIKQKNAFKVKIAKRGDRIERKKRGKEKEKKSEDSEKRRERLSKKNKDEKKKKKKEGEKSSNGKEMREKKDEGKNGVWMVRKNLEPGSILIQTRDTTTPKEIQPSVPLDTTEATSPLQRGAPQRNGGISRGKVSRRPRNEIKIYAPKQKQETKDPTSQESASTYRNFMET